MTQELQHNVLIVPDVHGRVFWREPLERFSDDISAGNMDVVFLGDYLDPYPDEVENDEAMNYVAATRQLKDIIKIARRHPQNVHLLIGNHDFHYMNDEYSRCFYRKCRYSQSNAESIKKVLRGNADVFRMAWDCMIRDTLFLFTHAGVLKSWVDMALEDNTIRRPNADLLNNMLDTGDVLPFASVGASRGDRFNFPPSPLWADYDDHVWAWKYEEYPERKQQRVYKDAIYQVFAHSLYSPGDVYESRDRYVVNDRFAMLDARKCFILNKDGEISEYQPE